MDDRVPPTGPVQLPVDLAIDLPVSFPSFADIIVPTKWRNTFAMSEPAVPKARSRLCDYCRFLI
jgi:hypothetical protein